VVLRKVDYGEFDRIYTLLCREHGKVGVIAKGVRRPQSRLASALELFSNLDVQLARGHNLDVVVQAVRIAGPRLAAEVERTAHAGLVAELADRVTEDRHPMDGVYELTVAALDELAQEPQPRRATAWFLMAALNFLGYAPQLFDCASCGRPLPAAPASFSPPAGGFLCPDCTVPGLALVPVAALKVLRVMGAGDIDLYRRLRLEGELMNEVEGVLEAQLEHHLDRQLRSLKFIRRLRTGSLA
jgi:DNA repair protein RecO (recombination protein O)